MVDVAPGGAGELTRTLAQFVATSRADAVPESVVHEARRSLVNFLGCALGGAGHEAVDRAYAAIAPFSGPPQSSLIGRGERTDCLHAALLNGMSGHVLDFDDTHLRTLLHPGVAVFPPLLALAEIRPITGRDLLHAFALGTDVACRIANAIYATHNVDWYITGTAGVIGAAAAAGRVLALSVEQMIWALGLAATQAAGLREMAGTMSKCYVHGRAAQNGLMAALLARHGFTSATHALEAPRGFAAVLAGARDLGPVAAGLGERWELALNTYKPHACGVVAHPVIDGCLHLRDAHGVDAAGVAAIALTVHPLALKLTGIPDPPDGLKSKWSIFHSAAVALVDGAAGEHQYTDARVHDPLVRRLRSTVTATADGMLRDDEALVEITLNDGRSLRHHVVHARGSADNPMRDSDLERKLMGLARGVLSDAQSGELLGACWRADALTDASVLARLAVP